MERQEIRARLAELRAELEGNVREINELLAQLHDDEEPIGKRQRFTIIKGGLGAVALPAAALTRRPRHPAALAATMVGAGALSAVLLIPARTTPGGPGALGTELSIPWAPPAAVAPATPRASATPHATPHATPAPPRATSSAPSPRTTASATASTQPPSPSALPTTALPSAPAPSTSGQPSPTAPCVLVIQVNGTDLVRVCLG